MNWTREDRAVNSKPLLKTITDSVESLLNASTHTFVSLCDPLDREIILELLKRDLKNISSETGKIRRIDVICDTRNNRASDMAEGIIHLEVQFNQTNCLNKTRILYTLMNSES